MRNKPFRLTLILSIILNLSFGFYYSKTFFKKAKSLTKSEILSDNKSKTDIIEDMDFHNGKEFRIWGKYHTEKKYNRLPSKFQKIVRPEVWNLSMNSAGMQIRFNTNSPVIGAKWEVSNNSCPANMSKVGACGIDLYCFIDGKWQYVNSGIPTGISNESLLISDMDTIYKDFLINFPLYDGINHIEIGIKKGFSIKSVDTIKSDKPIVFYGTSITQGGSASRPGMAYPSIIGRNLDIEIINLGFSGNGRFEQSIGLALCEIDAKLFVIDCTPNSPPDTIKNNTLKLIRQIRKCHPNTPILLVESIIREYAYFRKSDEFTFGSLKFIQAQNKELKKSFDDAINLGVKNIYYLESEGLIGFDHEGTVDGTHLTDLGQYRLADKIGMKIIEILNFK